jgi:hypothetical protein
MIRHFADHWPLQSWSVDIVHDYITRRRTQKNIMNDSVEVVQATLLDE